MHYLGNAGDVRLSSWSQPDNLQVIGNINTEQTSLDKDDNGNISHGIWKKMFDLVNFVVSEFIEEMQKSVNEVNLKL